VKFSYLKGGKDSHSRVGGVLREGFKLGSKGEGNITRLLTRDEHRHGMPVLGVRLIARLNRIYINARSMGNKQEELEAIV